MMTLKFSRNAKLTLALTGRRPVRSAADDDFEISRNAKVTRALKHVTLIMVPRFLRLCKNKIECDDTTITRSSGTISVCFSAVTVNDVYRKSEFKIKCRD